MSRLADTKPESPPRRSDSAMLQPGDLIPHFDDATVDGREVPYDRLWQHRNVVLFVAGGAERSCVVLSQGAAGSIVRAET